MDKSNHEERLKKICKNCKRANGRCIIDEPYIGLCAVTDREELIELWENDKNVRHNYTQQQGPQALPLSQGE